MISRAFRGALLGAVAAFVVLLITGCPQTAEPVGKYSKITSELEDFIKAELERGQVKGLSVALVDDQEVVWAKGFGWADEAKQTAAGEKTVYRVGSISKLFTDIGIMQQVEAGKIDLDADIKTYVPDFHIGDPFGTGKPTTLRHLMTHLSGFPRESPVGSYFDDTFPSLEDTVRSIYNTSLVYEPETKMKYSNIGVTLVGYALQLVSGEPYIEYERKHLLGPLGMTSSDFLLTKELEGRLSKAYMWVADGREIEAPHFELATVPAGNLYSTVEDLGKFLSCLFANGKAGETQIIKPESLEKMFEIQFHGADQPRFFGLGFVVGDYHGHKTVGHTGGIYGFTSIITGLPDEKIGVVVLLNEDSAMGPLYRIHNKALDLMLKAKLGEEPAAEPQIVEVSPEVLQGYVGEYESPRFWAEVKMNGSNLELNLSGQVCELKPLSETEFVVENKMIYDGRLTFEKDEAGAVKLMRYGRAEEFTRVDPAQVTKAPAAWQGYVGKYGKSFIPVIVSIRHGHLYAFIENEYDYRLTPVSDTVFNIAPGMYEGQQLEFKPGADGKVDRIVMAYVEFERLTP
jgi:CubicO group peptidase (beta-lactamase class C family)